MVNGVFHWRAGDHRERVERTPAWRKSKSVGINTSWDTELPVSIDGA